MTTIRGRRDMLSPSPNAQALAGDVGCSDGASIVFDCIVLLACARHRLPLNLRSSHRPSSVSLSPPVRHTLSDGSALDGDFVDGRVVVPSRGDPELEELRARAVGVGRRLDDALHLAAGVVDVDVEERLPRRRLRGLAALDRHQANVRRPALDRLHVAHRPELEHELLRVRARRCPEGRVIAVDDGRRRVALVERGGRADLRSVELECQLHSGGRRQTMARSPPAPTASGESGWSEAHNEQAVDRRVIEF